MRFCKERDQHTVGRGGSVVFCLLLLGCLLFFCPHGQAIAAGDMVPVGKTEIPSDSTSLDALTLSLSVEELLEALPRLPELTDICFVDSEGRCAYTADTVCELDPIRTAYPALRLRLSFDLFGQTVSSESERIEFYRVPIGNEGMEKLRAAAPYLRECRYLLIDGCGVDDAVMAQFRADFPSLGVVWRIWFDEEYYSSKLMTLKRSVMSDAERVRIRTVNDKNCALLGYCTETKYLDLGHNFYLSDFSFLAGMPKLEACIIAITSLHDLTPLEHCPELEYLEIFTTSVTDLSPLAKCTKLKHLNISNLKEVTDLTCLYGLELERLRAVVTKIPKEQFEEYARLHPDCEILMQGSDPTEGGWRYDSAGKQVPRYALLREQMKYDEDRANGIA